MSRLPLPRTPHRLDPIDGARAMDEQLLAMVVGLTSEVTILRARLDAAERLLEASGVLAPGAVDGFEPDAEAEAARERQRRATVDKVFRPLREAALAELASITPSGEAA
ncbi:hypothetical protein [Novosphingobium sp. AAP83]|uniref:hypothetical protein n=1 Tax=Novosphingobium sp. AAP83 TaxID=1523425 RepID=UPI000AD4389C|nr:hypothetical protein [Novosphingobium sp. AAP83]